MDQQQQVIKFTVSLDDNTHVLEVPAAILLEGEDFFQKMDSDMDQGWQMSRQWVDRPDLRQRCQIAADKMLDAIEKENETLLMLMAGYILNRMPGVTGVRVSQDGDMSENELL